MSIDGNFPIEESNMDHDQEEEVLLSEAAGPEEAGQTNAVSVVSTETSGQSSTTPVPDYPSPMYKEMTDLKARLNSFVDWPKSKSQKAEHLAEAGLFYSGPGDCVRCFYCGEEMSNWQDQEIPLVKHGRMSPDCSYMAHIGRKKFGDRTSREMPQSQNRNERSVTQAGTLSGVQSPRNFESNHEDRRSDHTELRYSLIQRGPIQHPSDEDGGRAVPHLPESVCSFPAHSLSGVKGMWYYQQSPSGRIRD